MAAWTWRPLFRGGATGVLTAIHTAPLGYRVLIRAMVVTNPNAGQAHLTVSIIQDPTLDGGTPRHVIFDQTIASGAAYLCPEIAWQILSPGGQVLISGDQMEYCASGALIPI